MDRGIHIDNIFSIAPGCIDISVLIIPVPYRCNCRAELCVNSLRCQPTALKSDGSSQISVLGRLPKNITDPEPAGAHHSIIACMGHICDVSETSFHPYKALRCIDIEIG